MKIESFFQFVLVMIVFAITGSLSLIVTVSLFEVLNLNVDSFSPLVFWPLRIIFIFFVYQVLLLIIAIPFIQLSFDDLTRDQNIYYYTVIHCNANWQPSD